jgi:peptide/nickel transport system ATP-binding protein
MKADVLRVKDLVVHYHTSLGAVKAADNISFSLKADERLGFAGESGSGKSTMALAILRMIKPPGRIEAGKVWLEGINVMTLSDEEMRHVRLARIAMIPQGSMNSLNQVIGREQIGMRSGSQARLSGHQLKAGPRPLTSVGLRPEVADVFPTNSAGVGSGVHAMPSAYVLRSSSPTSRPPWTVVKQVMQLARVQKDLEASVILVGHDMGLVAQFVDRLGVMYAGKLVEVSPVRDIFTKPLHPYTQMLIASLPSLEQKGTFRGIPGLPPLLRDLPPARSISVPPCLGSLPTEEPPEKVRTNSWGVPFTP